MAAEIRPDLLERLRNLARRENRQANDVLETMLTQYMPTLAPESPEDEEAQREAAVRRVRTRTYERARRYWREVGNQERLALTDEELDEQFWLIDHEGIPRLKSEQGTIELPPNGLLMMAEAAKKRGPNLAPPDASERVSELVGEIIMRKFLERRREQEKAMENDAAE